MNLHGSSRIGERTPEGGKDENVFDIQQGVAIALYVKAEEPQKERKVYYADLWGQRSEKYDYLLQNDVKTTEWQELKPVAPYYFLVPKDFALQKKYEKFWKVTEIFGEWGSGIITRRDALAVAFRQDELQNRMLMLTNPALPDSVVAETFKIGDTSEWNLHTARGSVEKEKIQEPIKEYRYRPWDFRHIYYSDSIVSRTCRKWMKHLLKPNVALALMRTPIPSEELTQVLVVDSIGDLNFYAFQTYFFPLYLYPEQPKGQLFEKEAGGPKRVPNFTAEFLQVVKDSLGTEPAPGEIFYYIYAVLYSPTYRQRYEEFLKIDFPKIPLPNDYEAFKALSNLGKELVDFHLLKHPALQKTEIGFPESGSNSVERVRYDEATQGVYINKDQYFDGISREVWEYHVGAYQVMEKYLKDRKGRKLSLDEINHYMKVAKAIRLTIGLQGKVDEVYLKAAG